MLKLQRYGQRDRKGGLAQFMPRSARHLRKKV